MNTSFLEIANGEVVKRERIPHFLFDDFRQRSLNIVKQGGRVVQFFAYPDEQDGLKLMAVLRTSDHDQENQQIASTLLAAGCDCPDSFPAFSAVCEPFHLFEREIAEQYGVKPDGHPWLKMVRYHANYRGKPDVFGNQYEDDIPGNYDYYSVKGDEIHEVAVGPVHAGVIEPGHFRFNCIGERVLNLEIQLGYQHRGVEALLLKADAKRLPIIAESIAGDTSVGSGLCLSQIVEALTGLKPDPGADIIRAIGLELERLANHVGDLGALSGDVAFLPPANYCGRMRGDFLNMTLLICGNRFGKGLVRAGGVRFDLNDDVRKELKSRLEVLKPQVEHTIDLLFSTPSVLSRFERCGTVSKEDAAHLGLVGPAGRACGWPYDVRRIFPTGHYAKLDIPEHAIFTGDVYARARMRADEVLQSMAMIQSLIGGSVETQPVESKTGESKTGESDMPNLAPSSFVVALNEAWRGELSHAVITDGEGKILRYKIKDPSFHNWNGLSMSLRDTGISDFPLNNKSFNLSYCGYDL